MEFSSGMTDDLTCRFFLYDMCVFFLFFCFAQVQRSSRQRATQNAGVKRVPTRTGPCCAPSACYPC